MFVMKMETFLELKTMRSHEDMLAEGKVFKWTPSMGRVWFMSHQWTSFSHPDPAAEQLTVAQVLTDMELHGLPLHLPTLRRPLGEVQRRCEALSREAEALLGGPLNLGSPQQVSEAVYARLTLC